MKKLFVAALCALAFVGFESCKKQTGKAAAVALEHAKMLKDGKYDLFIEEFHFEPTMSADHVAREKAELKHGMKTKVHPVITSKGGIKQSKVMSETVSPDGNKATVVVNHEYNNGQNDMATYELAKVDDTWKMDNSHMREVWKTKADDGSDLVIKLKENPHKDAMKEWTEDEHDFVKVVHEDGKEVVKTREGDHRDVEKVKEHKDGETVVKEIHDGHREVTRTK